MFKVGDRVYLLDHYDSCWGDTKPGDTGTVCQLMKGISGVRFDRDVGGHDCDGSCEMGYGFWITNKDLGKIEPDTDHIQPPDLELIF